MSAWEGPGASDEWFTPPHVFAALGEAFDLDVAAPETGVEHVPASTWLWRDGLSAPWHGFVWCNPPYGKRNALVPWLARFFDHGDGIALTPDRTSAPWFHDAWARADAVLFTRKLRFLRPDGSEGTSPSCGSTLWAAGQRATRALHAAQRAGLGIFSVLRV